MKSNTWNDPERWFWPRVRRRGINKCWPWTGTKHHKGYGAVKVEGRQWYAHQVAYRLVKGEPAMNVLHRCGTHLCCNPLHLYDGDDKQNAADRDRHGRTYHPKGEKNAMSKLTQADVDAIRVSTLPRPVLAARYGITLRSVFRIRARERW